MIRLGVNIDHVATLRQLRAGTVDYPDVQKAAMIAVRSGADQITIHLRGDRRHIQEEDLNFLAKNRPALLNLEIAATDEMVEHACRTRPDIVCLVPERREEVTTEGGLNVAGLFKSIEQATRTLKKAGVRVSLFIEPDRKQIQASQELGVDAVEFHTGQYALARGEKRAEELEALKEAFVKAHEGRLHVHAGHGLDYINVKDIVKLPFLEELNIGHSIVCRAVFVGLENAVREMKSLVTSK